MSTFQTFGPPALDRADVESPAPVSKRGRTNALVAPAIIFASFLVGYALRIGWPGWPVIDASERIAYSALAILPLAVGVEFLSRCRTRLPVNFLAALACVVPTMVPMFRPTDWSLASLLLYVCLASVAVAMLTSSAQRLASREVSPLVPFLLAGMSLATAGLLLMTGSIKLAEAAGYLAAGTLLSAIVSCWFFPARKSAGAVAAALPLLGGLIVSGMLWSNLPVWAACCVLAAPALAWLARLRPLYALCIHRRVVFTLLIAALPAIVACCKLGVQAYQDAQQSAADGSSDYGY